MTEVAAWKDKLIVLTGFRATGKTAVGRLLAQLCGYEFADTDAILIRRMGCSIAEAVTRHGWQYFREQERHLLVELTSWRNTVIATGGGAILHQQEWKLLRKQAFVIWLRTDLATTLARLRQDKNTVGQRPRLTNQGNNLEIETAALLAEREPLYRAGSDVMVDTAGRTTEEVTEVIFLSGKLPKMTSLKGKTAGYQSY
ncbi:shikimate kinase [Desulfobulbus sp. F5]|nr:shikimate kinase [Desulfobulbus sp. F5]